MNSNLTNLIKIARQLSEILAGEIPELNYEETLEDPHTFYRPGNALSTGSCTTFKF